MSKETSKRSESTEGVSGRDALGRRVWDKEFFKAKYEAASAMEPPTKKLATGPAEPLKPRTAAVDIEQRVTNASGKMQQGGFYCATCDCLLKDSVAYMDHVNGRSHNRLLGMSMQVEKVSVERVIEKMNRIRKGLE